MLLQFYVSNFLDLYVCTYSSSPATNYVVYLYGAEMEILKTIHWSVVKFDVLCIETNPSQRPPGYVAAVTAFMKERVIRTMPV